MYRRIVLVVAAAAAAACLSRPATTRLHRPEEVTVRAERPDHDDLERADDDVRAIRPLMQSGGGSSDAPDNQDSRGGSDDRQPHEHQMHRGDSFDGDVRTLPYEPPERLERPEHNEPLLTPSVVPGTVEVPQAPATDLATATATSAPAAIANFDGLDFAHWGAGHPPDPNGDVGPRYYIQVINTSIGIFEKTSGAPVAAFTFNTFSAGHFGNLCDTNNFGDPVVLYDTFEDRWVITNFAFRFVGGTTLAPAFECVAVSKTGDPVAGGWNFYSIESDDLLPDYPKFGVWPDGIYMSANMFTFETTAFVTTRVWAFNKAQMYAGAPTVEVVSFDVPGGDFTVLPGNARLQTGTPPTDSPNYFAATSLFLNAITVYKFHVNWNDLAASSFSGPDTPLASSSRPRGSPPLAPSQGGNNLDTIGLRAMMQNQYSNIGGIESLWTTHTVRRPGTDAGGNANGFAAPRWYQTSVTGGIVAPNLVQSTTFDPDGANVMFRFVPSLAVDRAGNMALGYSTSSSTTKPAIKYAGRLASDPVNTFSQAEQVLIQGAGTQKGNCNGTAGSGCTRWGDYSAMTLDPDGCTFWYTNMYYPVDGVDHHTRIGSFEFPACTPVGNGGTLQGTITAAVGGGPIAGALVALGSRTTTTDAGGHYAFSVPAGTYPIVSSSAAGFLSARATGIVIADADTTVRDLSLDPAPANGCFLDTTQSDFLAGTATNCDLKSNPGGVILTAPAPVDQQNVTVGDGTIIFGVGINTAIWGGQTFTAGVTGQLIKADINLFCAGCTGTTPNLTLSVRATTGGLPTGPDLATATIPGFSSGAVAFYTGIFSPAITVTAGTQYALVIRPTANPSAGTYALTRSGGQTLGADVYAGGTRVASTNSGATWVVPTTGGVTTDTAFHTIVFTGFSSLGTFVSSVKDANAANAAPPNWGALAWNAVTPAGTNVQLQAAASNNAFGPFPFVGPDGTSATFFSNGGSLAQFNGMRYLKYQAILTSGGTATPTLNDVTICFNSTAALTVAPAFGIYGGTTTLSAVLTAGGAGVSGRLIRFTLNGTSVGAALSNSAGAATLPNVSLAGFNAGRYPGAVGASFGGDDQFTLSSASADLTVGQAPLVAKADDKTKVEDYPNPPLTGTIIGIQLNDPITATYSTTATLTSPPGTYPIAPSLQDPAGKLGNYAVQIVNGTLTVTPSLRTQLRALRDALAPLAEASDSSTDERRRDAGLGLDRSLDPALWVDGNHLTVKGRRVFDTTGGVVEELMELDGAPAFAPAIAQVTAIDREIAATAIRETPPPASTRLQRELQEAAAELAEGDRQRDSGRFDRAIEEYGQAWTHAIGAMGILIDRDSDDHELEARDRRHD
jgi:MBG domain (YGX type)/Carboxypeptidase regulatory-like domain